jgi:hypothetical protein
MEFINLVSPVYYFFAFPASLSSISIWLLEFDRIAGKSALEIPTSSSFEELWFSMEMVLPSGGLLGLSVFLKVLWLEEVKLEGASPDFLIV